MITEPIVNAWPTLSRSLDAPKLRAVSFGAGVQSTTMVLMAARGLFGPLPDVLIFADTGDEPAAVYEHLEFMRSPNIGLPFPIITVSVGSIRDQMLDWSAGRTKHANGRPPLFVPGIDKVTGKPKVGQTKRQCTQDWKIVPIERKVRELVGIKKGSPGPRLPIVEQWIGISMDEIWRMKPARRRWIQNRHPLVEADMSRRDCDAWLAREYGIKAPKSACRICPFHSDMEWENLRKSPADFEAACEVDDALRSGNGFNLKGEAFLHRSCKPLREVDFTDKTPEPIAWLGECEGMCGL